MPYTLVADQPHQYLSTYDLPWLFYIWFLPPQFKERGGGEGFGISEDPFEQSQSWKIAYQSSNTVFPKLV